MSELASPSLTRWERAYFKWRTSSIARWPKQRRFNLIHSLVGPLAPDAKVLEVGYGHGADYIQFLPSTVEVHGIDMNPLPVDHPRFHGQKALAHSLPFADKEFDLAVSIGVFEHQSPVENLAQCINEIARVGKKYCVIIPCVATPFEPHARQFLWSLKQEKNKRDLGYVVNYFSDETWLRFEGFAGAKSVRSWYIPGLIRNLVIYKS